MDIFKVIVHKSLSNTRHILEFINCTTSTHWRYDYDHQVYDTGTLVTPQKVQEWLRQNKPELQLVAFVEQWERL